MLAPTADVFFSVSLMVIVILAYSFVVIGVYEIFVRYRDYKTLKITDRDMRGIFFFCGIIVWLLGGYLIDRTIYGLTGWPFSEHIYYSWPVLVPYSFGFILIPGSADRVCARLAYGAQASKLVGKQFRFDYRGSLNMHPDIAAHSGQTVRVRRILGGKWTPISIVEIEASDGWRSNAFIEELNSTNRLGDSPETDE